ncbi:hypothetical protein DRP53_02995 [candidate division WOR-3 bacterium]|uniref:Glycosyltransferase RgtA/B/C/D-like domain-containing protein n=1 Tax=candidate division WOR-3 bacterium TaxID=2052148 RepID=A0A660SJT0_UNCW3|nr:MAG: hypothetical protein DRP53_02995 [candidate division WOR-3 bacterium]
MAWRRTAVFLIIAISYLLTNYGGVRSPDSEVVFRTGLSLARRLSFAVERPLSWRGFGLARGRDGRLYSIFGPLESIVLAPLIRIGDLIIASGLIRGADIRPSHYIDQGLADFIGGRTVENPEPHRLRFIVSYLYLLIGILNSIIFYHIARRFLTEAGSLFVVTLYSLGTIAWGYSGTLFSEPLMILFILASFLLIDSRPFASGFLLGLATMTHITGILFLPFFLLYLHLKKGRPLVYGCGAAIPLILLCLYNHLRFGNPLETGRGISEYVYSYFVPPGPGLYGLLFSPGKGILIYSPAIIIGLLGWRLLHHKDPILSYCLIGTILLRILFIASRSDWPGGFCLGPRYLLPLLPFLLLPTGFLFERVSYKAVLLIPAFIFMLQQLYLNLGEIFSFFHIMKFRLIRSGIDPFQGYPIYLRWDTAPICSILKGKPGPYLLTNPIPFTLMLISLIIILYSETGQENR